MDLKSIVLIISVVVSLITLATVLIKGGMFLKTAADTKSEVLGLKNRVKENKQSAKKMIYDNSGVEKFVRAEKFDKLCDDQQEFQDKMIEFTTQTKVALNGITIQLENMNKTIDKQFKKDETLFL